MFWLSIQVAFGEGLFVESEVVSELVQVGAAHFLPERRAGVFAFVQDVFEVENDLRRRPGFVGVLVARGADARLRNDRDMTAADFARSAGRDTMAQQLAALAAAAPAPR